ncbi:hypothetical protein [Virgisporangium aurantiacum]|uniref:DUF1444 domain-containing protein n=1 Tax=Virgisporangium aurantiacum TaxID=175570 RepID=A0A8J3Z9F1_9ACTN|nr:hypothetical protein [Virgisporangium aurantiacum]GIJ57675.1 hypothetical protein Vau01_051910 [Virgisporangium aurantiacum]
MDARENFVAEVLSEMRAQGASDARFDEERFAVAYQRDADATQPVWMYLATLFAECEREPETRTDRIRRYVTTLLGTQEPPADWASVRPLLRPVLRGAMFGRSNESNRPAVLRRPAQPFLDELVVVDRPTSMSYVTAAMAANWGVGDEEVFATARGNLAAGGVLPDAEPAEGPVLLRFVDDGDAYWPSHLLLDGWLASLAGRVGGPPIAFVPDVNTLMVTAADPDGLAPLLELIADEYLEAPRRLSPVGYTVDAVGRVVPYAAPSGHSVSAMLGRAERLLATHEYAAQRELLAEADLPEFVAKLELFARDDGSVFTVTAWTTSLPTLLPRADYVGLVVDGAEPFFVPWPAVTGEGLCAEAVEYRPVRYRTVPDVGPPLVTVLRQQAVDP